MRDATRSLLILLRLLFLAASFGNSGRFFGRRAATRLGCRPGADEHGRLVLLSVVEALRDVSVFAGNIVLVLFFLVFFRATAFFPLTSAGAVFLLALLHGHRVEFD